MLINFCLFFIVNLFIDFKRLSQELRKLGEKLFLLLQNEWTSLQAITWMRSHIMFTKRSQTLKHTCYDYIKFI